MTAPTGIVATSLPSASGEVVRIGLDARVHRFLRDHLVDGRPLLSTVMGIETIACAVRAARPSASIDSVNDVQVGPPYLLPADGVGAVEVSMSEVSVSGGTALRCQVRSGAGEAHFSAVVATGSAVEPANVNRPAQLPDRQVARDTVYGLYFHGPSFQVIETAGIAGSTAVARLTRQLPSIVAPARRSITAPLLVELCLQTAGLWDLAAGRGMTIPRRIDQVRRFGDVDSHATTTLFAVVEAGEDETGLRFDARVVDDEGHVHLAVDGYRTTAFAHPYDVRAADRILAQLGVSPAPRASP